MTAATGFEIPSATLAAYPAMSRYYAADVQIQEAAAEGNFVVVGGIVTAGSGYTVSISQFLGSASRRRFSVVAGTNLSVGAGADATNPKWILVELSPGNTVTFTHGSAAASPIVPDTTAGRVAVATLYVPANANSFEAWQGSADGKGQIISKRVVRGHPWTRGRSVATLAGAVMP